MKAPISGVKTPMSEVLRRAGAFFMRKSPVHAAVARIAAALSEMDIPFAIAGAMAVNAHGHVRMTEDVDVLLSAEGLARFKEKWLGRGWVEQFPGSRGLHDTVHGVRIDVLLQGDYPGDGLPKPVAFPDPADVSEPDANGIPVLSLPSLITLKLACAMTAPQRPQDLADVIQLIRNRKLPRSFAGGLDPFVRDKYLELWNLAQKSDQPWEKR